MQIWSGCTTTGLRKSQQRQDWHSLRLQVTQISLVAPLYQSFYSEPFHDFRSNKHLGMLDQQLLSAFSFPVTPSSEAQPAADSVFGTWPSFNKKRRVRTWH